MQSRYQVGLLDLGKGTPCHFSTELRYSFSILFGNLSRQPLPIDHGR